MNKIVTIVLAMLLVASVVFAAAVKPLSVKDAQALIAKAPNLYILDVRTPDEYRQARMKNSVLIPVNDLERRLNEVPRNRPVLVICAVGARSKQASEFLVAQGYKEVYHLNDGLVGWYRAGLPIER